MSNATTKRPAPGKGRASNADNEKPTGCRCAAQLQIPGFPPPPDPFRGPLVEWLEAHPGWWGREYLCNVLGMDERTLRLQAEHSNGAVIFSSSGSACGLKATVHADEVEVRACIAELDGRAGSHHRRARDIARAAKLEGVRT
jgi:hypothetical protein